MKDINTIQINRSTTAISDYCETALNVAEKLRDEYFFSVPANFDEDVFSTQLDKIINNYDYIAFAVAIINDALKHIEESNGDITDVIGREVELSDVG